MSSITQAGNTLQAASAMPASPSDFLPRETASTPIPGDSPATQVTLSDSARLLAQADSADDTEDTAPVQSFVYGALGLESPEEQAKAENGYYSAGKWLAAAATVGTMVSLLI